MEIKLIVEFEWEEIVYLKTDIEQKPRMITGYKIRPHSLMYVLTSGVNEDTQHFECEISRERNILLTSTN